MINLRKGTFETNSSSTHSLVMCSGDEWDLLEKNEAFCQPAIPYVEYYLREKAFEDCTPYIQNGIRKCDDYIKMLVDNKVIRFKED